jgi:hypothetical protein
MQSRRKLEADLDRPEWNWLQNFKRPVRIMFFRALLSSIRCKFSAERVGLAAPIPGGAIRPAPLVPS